MKLNSSKIPRINIEIPDYKFFHSPSQMEKDDNRFIGRDSIIAKLRMILTNNESKTGSYLITGYRGMGKSSFVNKVLNQITLKKFRWHIHAIICFSIWVLLSILTLLIQSPLIELSVIITLFILAELIYYSFKKGRIKNYPSLSKKRSIFFIYILTNSAIYFILIVDIAFTLIYYTYSIDNPQVYNRLIATFITLSGVLYFYNNYYYSQILDKYYFLEFISLDKKKIKKIWNYLYFKLKLISGLALKYFQEINDRRKRVVIHLNLGHEELDEKDIAGLIARNLETEFKRFSYSFRRQWLFYTIKITLFITIAGYLASPTNNSLQSNLTTLTHIYLLFPSQTIRNLTQSESDFENGTSTIPYRDIKKNNSITNNISEKIQQKSREDSTIKSKGSEPENSSTNRNLLSQSLQRVKEIIKFIDIYLEQSFAYITWGLFGVRIHLNYFFLIYCLLLNFVIKAALLIYYESRYSASTSRRMVLRKLKFLNDNIDASIRRENTYEAGQAINTFTLKSKFGVVKEYPVAGARQIEKNLIDVLDDISNLAPWILKPEFIFVFDELDKIDPKSDKGETEILYADYDASASGFTGGTSTRIRRQNVLRLLGNLKYLITTAKAKFIFISGRELYDAFLADVSDRQFSISSIFHEVIYVESFLSDASDEKKGDIVSMAEHYVCQILIPNWYLDCLKYEKEYEKKNRYDILTLKNYERYLGETKILTDEKELERLTLLLYQFINYLTHVSNGAPKKISNLVEKHFIEVNEIEKEDKKNLIYIGTQSPGIYLSFGYVDQCKIGFIHYLAHPIMLGIMNNVSPYGDKLLISASFLIDHIFKFHNNGFSWRNIENTPEILDSSKTPELRSLIDSIVSYLTQIHLSSIISGLYIFKFPKKISEEIQYVSKMSEEASAIFNFSLDESLSVKIHYTRLLDGFLKLYTKEKELRGSGKTDLLHTISNIHHILGDLHLLDEEYTEAIFEYQNCIQFAATNFKGTYDPHNDSHILFIVRNLLKLGLAFEKRKTYNSAYVIYSELISILIDYRYLTEDKLGLEYKIEVLQDWRKYGSILYKKKEKEDVSNKVDTFRQETLPAFFEGDTNIEMSFIFKGEEVNPGFAQITTPLKNKIISRLSMFEDMRLMYQALLAKLFVLEKQQLGGISQENIDVVEGEFLYLHLATNLKDKFLISADFFKKVGDILFYKNGLITHHSSNLFASLYFWDYDIRWDIDRFTKKMDDKELLKYLLNIGFRNFQKYTDEKIEKEKSLLNKTVFRGAFVDFLNKEIDDRNSETNKEIKYVFEHMKSPKKTTQGEFNDLLKRFIGDEKSFNPPSHKLHLISKAMDCCEKRDYLLHTRNIAPCYACKYYNRSLKILADNLLNLTENEYPSTKAILFLEALEDNAYKFYSNRANFNQSLASTLGGFGDVMVSCSTEQDYIFPDFLSELLDYIIGAKGINFLKNNVNSRTKKNHLDNIPDNDQLWSDDFLIKQIIISEYFKPERKIELTKIFRQIDDKLFGIESGNEELNIFNKTSIVKVYIDDNPLIKNEIVKILQENNKYTNIEYQLLVIYNKGISQLEKALLYYLASAKYYKRSSNFREAAFMYKKILKVLIQFVESKPIYKAWIGDQIDNIGTQITRRIIQNVHSSYDHIHVAEANRFKIFSTDKFYQNLSLNQLSIFPELEDVIYTHYRLSITCGCLNIKDEDFKHLYNMPSLTSVRLNSSIYNRLISLRFKSFLSQKIFEEQLYPFKLNHLYNKSTCSFFYDALVLLLERPENRFSIEEIEDIIIDSIFCLQKFIEVAYPHNTNTLFNHG